MTETIRIENVIAATAAAVLKAGRSGIPRAELQKLVAQRVDGLREGDFRAAVSQLVDANRVHITTDRKVVRGG